MRGHFAVGFRYGSHGRSAVRGAPKRTSHALPSPPSSLLPTLYFLLPSFAISPHDNTVHIVSCITCGMFSVKCAEINHNYLICNKL